MALNLTNLFTGLGRAGRNAYLINSGSQALQSVPFTEFVGYSYVNPAWAANLSSSYDAGIRSQTSSMAAWTQAAQNLLQGLVGADDPAYGTSLGSSLQYLYAQMVAQSKTVQQCTITGASVAEAANVGKGVVFITLNRGDGLSLQNTIAEVGTVLITADSFTGGQTAGQEPWQWAGAPNLSSLGTRVNVNLWDWDWPQGSGTAASGRCIAGNDYANTGGNFLQYGDFASWTTGPPPIPNNWYMTGGTWGVDIAQETGTVLSGPYSVKFVAGTGTTEYLSQQFNSTTSDGTNVAAGTSASLAGLGLRSFMVNLWLRAAGVITGGVMTVSLVDSSGAVINDQQGVANSGTITLSTVGSAAWEAHGFNFRLPVVLPSDGIIRLRIRISTALTGANLFMDDVAFCAPVNLYTGGPSIAVFSQAATPFEAGPDPDGFTVTFTNNRGGASYGATWQTLINRLFQTPTLILPYSNAPNILDSLITGV